MLLRNRIITTTGVIGGLSLLLLGAAVAPSVVSVRQTTASIAAERATIEEKYVARDRVRSSLDRYRESADELAMLRDLAIREGEELAFVSALETAAERYGLSQELSLETANQTALSEWETEIPVKVRLSGPFPAIVRYMGDIERLPQALVILDGSIRTPQQYAFNNPNGFVEALLSGKVLWVAKSAPSFISGDIGSESTDAARQ